MTPFVPGVHAPADHTGESLYFAFRDDRLLVQLDTRCARVPWATRLGDVGLEPAGQHYLGRTADRDGDPRGGRHCFAVDVDVEAEAPDGLSFQGLRRLFGLVDDETFSVAGRAFQIVNWDRTHRFCGRCGTATRHHDKDRARQCPECGLISYPRVSPAIITLVSRGDEFLLARNASFPGKRYSILAGFVEAGETLEETVIREIREEVGLEVEKVTYFGSQPWPFPHSLMIGFTAEHASGDIDIDAKRSSTPDGTGPATFPNYPTASASRAGLSLVPGRAQLKAHRFALELEALHR